MPVLPDSHTAPRAFYGWPLLFILWVVYTLPIGFAFYGPAILYPYMIDEMGWSRGKTMVGATALMLFFGLASPLTALLIQRIGARRTIFGGGLLCAAAAFAATGLGHLYPAFIGLCAVVGLGVSLSSMLPVQTVAIAWFHARRAMALGLVLGGGAIGGFVGPQIISWAVLRAGGDWRVGWVLIGATSLAGALVGVLGVRNRPADMGQHPDGRDPATEGGSASGAAPAARTYRTSAVWSVATAFRTRALWLLVVAASGSFFLWQVVVTQAPLHLQDRGFDPSTCAFLYSLALGLSVAGRFTIAVLGDRIEPRYLFAFGSLCILAGGVFFWFASPATPWVAYLYPLLAGFGFGAAYICVPTIVGNYWGPEAFAGISGLLSPLTLLAQGFAAPVAGFLYDLQGHYLGAMSICWAGAGLGFVAMLLCTPPAPPAGAYLPPAGRQEEIG